MSDPKNMPPRLEPRKIYLKDVSFESPQSPAIFNRNEAAPKLDVQMTLQHQRLNNNEGFYEVVLNVTATAAADDQTIFLAEVQQAGVFELNHVSEKNIEAVLEIACPNILLAFAREEISSLVTKGGFPQLLINPVNFEALYLKKRDKEAKSVSDPGGSSRPH